jgi:putative Flp pilus-assembly TadE/G-like protein
MSVDAQTRHGRDSERGSIIIMTAIFMLLLFLMLGFCIDVSRIYVVRSELQNAADFAALTAAREINGGPAGIDKAVSQAIDVIANNQGLQAKAKVGIVSVTFARNLNDDPYMNAAAAKLVAGQIIFVKVTTETTATSILFGGQALGASHNESREAVAGKSVDLAGLCDFYPAAVGMNDQDPTDTDALGQPIFTYPPTGTRLTLKFAQGSGNSAVINNMDYIVLEVPCITGNGDVETARLSGGEPCACNTLGGSIHMTPSSNLGNGGKAAGNGMNTRFGAYVGGYGGYLQCCTYASDTNVTEGITHLQYITNPGAGNDRRVIIAPIVKPDTYPADTDGRILGWGKFFLRSKMFVDFNGNCSDNAPCGYMDVEFLGQANVGATGPVACDSGLQTAVLYR